MPLNHADLTADISTFIEKHSKGYLPHNKKQLIDLCTSSVSYFKEDGFSHLDIKKEVVRQLA